jgi:hypothetical protein
VLRAIIWQKLRSLGILLVSVAVLIAIAGTINSCGGGGGQQIVPPPASDDGQQGTTNRPIITSVLPRAAGVGQNITITGFYFGDTEGTNSNVTIGGRKFTIVSWSDQAIEATIPTDATSGIVVVTVGTLSSRSGLNAQIYVGSAPPAGEPLIKRLSADTGPIGTPLTVTGYNFGASQGDSRVTFAGVDPVGNPIRIPAQKYNEWSNTSIQVIVPPKSTTGPVIVTVGQNNSNDNFVFIPLPQTPAGPPVIDKVTPGNGPVETEVTIEGNNFGDSRGVSVVYIGDIDHSLQVSKKDGEDLWTNNEIVAKIPRDATSGRIKVLVGGITAQSPGVFIVGEVVPSLTSMQPNVLQVGAPLQIYGRDFGLEKGSVRLTPTGDLPGQPPPPGQTPTVIRGNDITSWSNTEIRIDLLPTVNSDAGVPVEVTITSGGSSPQQSSNSFIANVFSPIEATLTSSRPAGVANGESFTFTLNVGGGTAPYEVEFMFGDGQTYNNPSPVNSSASADHTYGAASTYTPSVRITDDTGSRITVFGSPVLVVAEGQPVIYDLKVITLGTNFNPDNSNFKPNATSGIYFGQYQNSVFNFDETFIPVLPAVGLDFMTYAKVQYPLFAAQDIGGVLYGGRPYAYRGNFVGGSVLNIYGYNLTAGMPFGAHVLSLNDGSNIGTTFPIANGSANIFAWTDAAIQFKAPNTSNKIGGPFKIIFDAGTGLDPIDSPIPLVAAPALHTYTMGADGHTITINLNDPVPDVVDTAYMGTKAYMFWSFPAKDATTNAPYLYDRNGDGGNDNYLLPGGIPITLLPDQNTITFDLDTIGHGGPYAARDPATTGAVAVNPDTGNWNVFLWVGVKQSPFAENFANSGIISNDLTINNYTP